MAGLILLLFCALVLAAGACAVGPSFRESRGEQALGAVTVALGIVLVPIHALAWSRVLSRSSVCASIAVVSFAAVATAIPITRRAAAASACLSLMRLPWDALVYARRERHVAGLGLLGFIAIAAYTLSLAFLAPSTTWDGLWYHESIVGFTLQFGGVADAVVDSRHQYVNGYPALAEYLQLFTVVAGRRDFVDAVPTVMGGVLLLASYVLARRFVDRMRALGFALAIVLVPAVVLQFRSTLVDVTVAAFAASSMALLTRSRLRWSDVLLAALSIGLLAGTKVSGALLAGLYALVLAARVVLANLQAGVRRRGLAQLMAAAAIVASIGAPRYVTNFVAHANPIWPLDFRVAGIKLKGKPNAAPRDKPAREVLAGMLAPPSANDSADSRDHGYGSALPYTAFPLAGIALLALGWHLARARLRGDPIAAEEAVLLALALASGVGLWLVPAVWWARLHLHAVVIAVVLNAWLLRRYRSLRLSDALIGALLFSELVTISWSTAAWGVTLDQAAELAREPANLRRLRDLGQTIRFPEDVARALEREVGANELVVYDGSYLFLANLWNSHYSNRVSYVACSKQGYDTALLQAGATWAIAARDECKQQLDASASWEQVGAVDGGSVAYRKRSQPSAAPSVVEPPAKPPAPAPATDPPSIAAKPDCHKALPETKYVAPRVSAADAEAALQSRKLKGDRPRVLDGPIVGAVTHNSALIWIKADRAAAWQLEVRPQDHPGETRWIDGPALAADSDFTGSVTLTGLRTTTRYLLRLAMREPQASPQQPLAADAEGSFRTLPAPGTRGHVRIVVGADIAHDLDQPIFAQIPPLAPDAVFLIGDQMYSDAIGPDFASYANKYTASWRIGQLRELMQSFPTFMIWDDHEIVDDYYAGKSERYAPARLAYELYVQGHNPAPLREGKLYYTVEIGEIGFFVLDTRSERSDPSAPEGPTKSMLGALQKADLFRWLACDKSRIKVIVTTVVMSDRVNHHDSWNAFPTEREELFSFIERERVDDVVLLSGDQHWSAVFAHERPHLRIYEFLPTPLSKARAHASTESAPDILARDDDNFVFGVVDFDTRKSPASVAFTLCALGKPCRPGAEPAPKTGLNLRGAEENVPFTFRFTTSDYGIR